MPGNEEKTGITIQEGEKISSVMVYTLNLLVWGDVITKTAIRVSTWLRTPAIPQYICLQNAQVLTIGGSAVPKPQPFRELYLPSSQVIAFHLKPPANDPLDYDPKEPNRKMELTTALVGSFRFDGGIRMATITNLNKYLEVAKEAFTPMYDASITQPNWPSMGVIRVSYVLLRNDQVIFSPRGE